MSMGKRELAVTVTASFDLAYIESLYADAIDGGYTGTLNAYVEEWADSVASDMQGESRCRYETDWKLRDTPGVSAFVCDVDENGGQA